MGLPPSELDPKAPLLLRDETSSGISNYVQFTSIQPSLDSSIHSYRPCCVTISLQEQETRKHNDVTGSVFPAALTPFPSFFIPPSV